MPRAYEVLVVVGASMFLIELCIRRRRADRVDLRQAGLSVRVGVLAYALAGVSQAVIMSVGFWAGDRFVPWKLSALDPLVWLAYIALDDFTAYWMHRASHRYRVLWSAHLVHHSPTDFAMINSARLSPVEAMYQPLVTLWAPLLGFPVAIYAPITVGYLLLSEFQHSTIVGRLGWLDRWVTTPSSHRVHHGRNPEYLDRNFGTYTMVWDRLFGTYQPETVTAEFGVTDQLSFHAALVVAAGGYPALARDMRHSGNWHGAVATMFDSPRGSKGPALNRAERGEALA